MRVRRANTSCLLLAILVLLRCSVTEYKYLADSRPYIYSGNTEVNSGLQATWWFQGDGISYKENFLDFALYSSNDVLFTTRIPHGWMDNDAITDNFLHRYLSKRHRMKRHKTPCFYYPNSSAAFNMELMGI